MASKLRKAEDDKAAVLKAMQALADAAGDGKLDAAEECEWNRLVAEVDDLDAVIDRENKINEYQATLKPVNLSGVPTGYEGIGVGGFSSSGNTRAGDQVRGGRKYAEMFGASAASSNDGFSSLDAYLQILHSNAFHPSLRPMAAMGEGDGASGGYAIPTYYAARLLDAALENEIVRPRATIEPMQSETLKVAGVDASDNSTGALFGGISGQWLGEHAEATNEDIAFRKIELHARKLAVFTIASNELIADGQQLEAQLQGKLIEGVGWHLDNAFLNGNGVGQPRGVLNDSSLVVTSKEDGQAADSITYTNVCAMLARLHVASFARSVWVCNPTTIPKLLTLSVPVGTGGSHVPAMVESNGQFTLLTRPVLFSEKLPVLGEQGDILLADFSQYIVGLRREVSLEKSLHVRWQTDESAYRCVVRTDGQGSWNEPFTPLHGDTQSWCVVLEAR